MSGTSSLSAATVVLRSAYVALLCHILGEVSSRDVENKLVNCSGSFQCGLEMIHL